MFQNIDVITLNRMLKEPNTHLIDVRDREEFLINKIEGAINLDINYIDDILKIVPDKDSNIIVCCSKGIRSVAAGERMCELGYKKVYNLDGGMSVFFNQAK